MPAFNPSHELSVIPKEILGQTSDLFIVLDEKANDFLHVNHSFANIWGKNQDTLYEEKWDYFLTLIPKTHHTLFLKMIRQTIYLKQNHTADCPFYFEGKINFFRCDFYFITSTEMPRIVFIIRNIHSIYEKILTDFEKKETELIISKNVALDSANNKTQFLSTMSHEIRTPLNAVIGITQLLLEENHTKDVYKNLKILKFSADNLLVLINDILDFNKIEAGKIRFEKIHFDLQDMMKGIKHTFGLQAKEKGIRLKLHYDEDIPKALIGDPIRLAQILTNLVGNAIKFTEKGAVRIFAELEEENEDFATVEFRVEDTGIGIAEDKQEIVFERFTQAETDISRKFGGTGLGLSITKRLLELQNSQIHLKSQLNEGSQFFFYLKLPKGKKKKITYGKFQNEVGERNLNQARILIVEDNAVNQLVISQFLKKWNTQIDTANDGKEAFLKVQTNRYDLVLMDLQMPKMNGYEATTAIRNLPEKHFESLPIIALTAETLHDIKNKITKAGMVDYVSKPFNALDLYNRITKHLNLESKKTTNHIPMKSPDTSGTPKNLINPQGIVELSDGDKSVISDFVELNRVGFKDFKQNYRTGMYSGELEKLRKVVHKMKSTARFLHFQILLDLMEYGKKLIISENRTSNDVESHLSEIENLSDIAIQELESLLKKS